MPTVLQRRQGYYRTEGYFGGGTIDLEAQLPYGIGRSSTQPIS